MLKSAAVSHAGPALPQIAKPRLFGGRVFTSVLDYSAQRSSIRRRTSTIRRARSSIRRGSVSKPRLFGFKIVYSAALVYSAKGLVYSAKTVGTEQLYHKGTTADHQVPIFKNNDFRDYGLKHDILLGSFPDLTVAMLGDPKDLSNCSRKTLRP